MLDDHPRLRLLRGDEADIFDAHQLALRCAVRRAVSAPEACIEDACAFAWLQFLRRQPDRATVFAWLRTVAVREAWRLSRRERRDAHLEEVPPGRRSTAATPPSRPSTRTKSYTPSPAFPPASAATSRC